MLDNWVDWIFFIVGIIITALGGLFTYTVIVIEQRIEKHMVLLLAIGIMLMLVGLFV